MLPVNQGDRAAVLHVAVGARRVVWGWVRPGLRAPEHVSSTELADGLPESLQAAIGELAAAGAQMLAQGGKVQGMRVVLADAWLCVCQVPWSDELKSADAAPRYTRSQLEMAGFTVEDGDTLRLDDGPYGAPRLAVVYPAALLTSLRQAAEACGTVLKAVLPLSAAAWAWRGQQKGLDVRVPLLVWEPGCLMVLQGERQLSDAAVRGAAFGFEAAEPVPQALLTQWQRMCFRTPALERLTQLQGLCLWPLEAAWPALPAIVTDVPLPLADAQRAEPLLQLSIGQPALSSVLDPVAAGRRAGTPLQKALLLCLVGAAVALGIKTVSHWQQRRDVEAHLAEDGRRALPTEKPAAEWRADPARVAAVNAAIRELNVPVSALMLALQAPRDMRVALLSVDLAAADTASQGSSIVKITAEARSGAEMARYVSHISGRAPLGIAYLTRHEVQEVNPEQPYRFMVEAQWTR